MHVLVHCTSPQLFVARIDDTPDSMGFCATGRLMTTPLTSKRAVSSGSCVKRSKLPSTSTMLLGLAL